MDHTYVHLSRVLVASSTRSAWARGSILTPYPMCVLTEIHASERGIELDLGEQWAKSLIIIVMISHAKRVLGTNSVCANQGKLKGLGQLAS